MEKNEEDFAVTEYCIFAKKRAKYSLNVLNQILNIPVNMRYSIRTNPDCLKNICLLFKYMFEKHRYEVLTIVIPSYFKIGIQISRLIVECADDILQYIDIQYLSLTEANIVCGPNILNGLNTEQIFDIIFPTSEDDANITANQVENLNNILKNYDKRYEFGEYESGNIFEESKLYRSLSIDLYEELELPERY